MNFIHEFIIQMMPNNWFILNLINLMILLMMIIKFNKKNSMKKIYKKLNK